VNADDGDRAVSSAERARINRAYWDSLAAVHGNGDDRYYDVAALLAGESTLTDIEERAVRSAVGDVAGLDVLHVQCHIGFDTITLARRGARVTGVDLSPASLAKAAELAERCGVDAAFVAGDSTDLPAELYDRFDLAYATIGVINWIDDMGAWMRSAARCLRPGGHLVLADLHPMVVMLDSADPPRFGWPYQDTRAFVEDQQGSYANADAALAAPTSVSYAHGIGDLITAALGAGLRLTGFEEHTSMGFDPLGILFSREEDGRYRVRADGQPLPVMFTLLAARPG
jgi:SAM-dependent methyltransferase